MAISNLGGAGSLNWSLISSVTPTNGASTVSFTSVPTYQYLLLREIAAVTAATDIRAVRLNNSTTPTDYISTFWDEVDLASKGNLVAYFEMANTIGGTGSGSYAIISEADTSSFKRVSTMGINRILINGLFNASAAVNRVDYILATSTFNGTGTVALYGANNL